MANLKSTFFCNSVESMTLWLTSHPLSQSSNPSQELNQDHLCIGKSEKLFNTESTMQTELWTDWMVTQKLRYVLPDLSARQVKQCSLFLSGGQLHLLLLSFSELYGVYDSMDARVCSQTTATWLLAANHASASYKAAQPDRAAWMATPLRCQIHNML